MRNTRGDSPAVIVILALQVVGVFGTGMFILVNGHLLVGAAITAFSLLMGLAVLWLSRRGK